MIYQLVTSDESYRQYMEEISAIPLLEKEEEELLAKRAAAGDKEAKRKLIEASLRLVVYCVHRGRTFPGMDQMDLIQQGNLGLMHAAEKFDQAKGARFSTYAVPWITSYITRYMYQYSQIVTIPMHAADDLRAAKSLSAHLQRQPTAQELCRKIGRGCTPDRAASVLAWMYPQIEWMDAPTTEDDTRTLGELIPDDHADPAWIVERQEEQEEAVAAVEALLNKLGERQKTVVMLEYGVCGALETGNHSRIAEKMHISPQRVGVLSRTAAAKMRG